MSNTRFVSHRDLTQQKLLELVKADLQGRWENLLHNCIYFSGQASKHSSPIILPLALKNLTTNDEPSMLVSEQSSLIEVFDKKEIEGQLLILGESGSGKTTILLQLAQILVSRAEQDERQPIPILLNLSVEKNPQQTFKQWLIKNLKVVYGIRPDIAQKWLEESAIIPLLDGLDRLTPEHRQRCVQNINQFLAHESWSNSFIICDRLPQNSSQESQLNLNYCLILQPLNISQIQDYLSDSDSKNLEGVIHNNPNLMVLAQVPLFLNMMIICSEQITFHQWELIDSVDKTRQQLLTIYCQKRLKQLPQKNVREKLMERWLGWLATQLKRNGFSDFRLEYLQPYWLKNGEEQLMYGAIFGIISGLIYASSIFVILIRIILLTYSSLQQAWAILALFVSMAGITFMMLIMGFIYGLRVNIMPFTEFDSLSPLNARKLLKHNLIRGLIYGLIAGLIFANPIRFVVVMGGLGLIIGLIQILMNRWDQPKIESRIHPNQDVYKKANQGIYIILLILMPSVTILWASSLGIITFLATEDIRALMIISLGTIIYFSLYSVWQYLSLRFVLWLYGHSPWNYPKLLNYAVKLSFVEKIRGNYQFSHQSLQEYFEQLPQNKVY